MSITGIMSSQPFAKGLSESIDPKLASYFRVHVLSSTVLYCSHSTDFEGQSHPELFQLSSFSGSMVLRMVEAMLRPNRLNSSSLSTLKSMFMITLGIIFAVEYSELQTQTSGAANKPAQRHKLDVERLQNFACAQSQLSRILTHFLIVIAERVDLIIGEASKESMMKYLMDKDVWHAGFVWQPELRFQGGADLQGSNMPAWPDPLCRSFDNLDTHFVEILSCNHTFVPDEGYELALVERPPHLKRPEQTLLQQTYSVRQRALASDPFIPEPARSPSETNISRLDAISKFNAWSSSGASNLDAALPILRAFSRAQWEVASTDFLFRAWKQSFIRPLPQTMIRDRLEGLDWTYEASLRDYGYRTAYRKKINGRDSLHRGRLLA